MNLTAACAALRQYAEERMLEAGLSPREIDLARLWLRGLSNHEAAAHMGIERQTLNTFSEKIYRKLDVNTRSEFFVYFLPVFGEPGA